MVFALQVLQIVGVIGAAVWAASTYWLTRRRELAFHRTEFIIKQSEYLDNDAEMRECTLLLYGKHPRWTVKQLLDIAVGLNQPTAEHDELIIKCEKYLNFLWRIAYAHYELGTLEKKDLDAFGAYFYAVGNHAALRAYCDDQGYDEIVRACDDLGYDAMLDGGDLSNAESGPLPSRAPRALQTLQPNMPLQPTSDAPAPADS